MTSRRVLGFERQNDTGVQFTMEPDALRIHIHDDFCGDSIIGLGAELGFELTRREAATLRDELDRWLDSDPAQP